MFRWTIFVLVGLVALVGLIALIGYFLPQGHRASRTVEFAVPPSAVFAAITDIRRFPEWRSDLKQIEVLPDDERGALFREHGKNGVITFRIEQLEPNVKLVTRIADSSLPFGGSWTQELQPTATGTRLTVTENGEVYNPIFRFMSKFVFSQHATIDAYLADLQKRLARHT